MLLTVVARRMELPPGQGVQQQHQLQQLRVGKVGVFDDRIERPLGHFRGDVGLFVPTTQTAAVLVVSRAVVHPDHPRTGRSAGVSVGVAVA